MPQRVQRTRNYGTLTEAMYWSRVRSALRGAFQWWKPAQEAMRMAKRGTKYECAHCHALFPGKEVERDHIVPVGSLRCPEDLAGFLERLTPEDPAAFQILCKACHKTKTHLGNP